MVEIASPTRDNARVFLLGAWVTPLDQRQAIARILSWCAARARQYVVTPNLDHCRALATNEALAAAYDKAGLSLADGWPLVMASYLAPFPIRQRVTGADIIEPLCMACAALNYSVFLLGTTEQALVQASTALRQTIPGLAIAGTYSPPFGFENDPAEMERVDAAIARANPHLVFVALGSPKQELWMSDRVSHLPIGAAIGVGAGIDFIAGLQRRAPFILRLLGLEWAWRAATEPKRLLKRYIACFLAFPGLLLKHLVRHYIRRDGVR